MNVFDIIILAVLLIFTVKGLMRGMINEMSSLAGLIIGGWLAYHYHPLLAQPVATVLHIPPAVASFLSFFLVLIAVGLVVHILGNMITTALKLVMLGGVNRLGGALFGAAEGAVLLCLVFSVATSGFMPDTLKKRIQTSESAGVFARSGDRLLHIWRGSSLHRP